MSWIEDLVSLADAVLLTATRTEGEQQVCCHCDAVLSGGGVKPPGAHHLPHCPVTVAHRILAQARESSEQLLTDRVSGT